jgi:CRT-like, chloroquine-resistance transporter-like
MSPCLWRMPELPASGAALCITGKVLLANSSSCMVVLEHATHQYTYAHLLINTRVRVACTTSSYTSATAAAVHSATHTLTVAYAYMLYISNSNADRHTSTHAVYTLLSHNTYTHCTTLHKTLLHTTQTAVMIASCVPMALSSVYKEIALGEAELDPIYLNGWVAVFQFAISIPLALPAALAGSPPVMPEQLPESIWDGESLMHIQLLEQLLCFVSFRHMVHSISLVHCVLVYDLYASMYIYLMTSWRFPA